MKRQHLTSEDLALFWRELEKPSVSEEVRNSLLLLLLTGVRAAELYRARWEDIDFAAATWSIHS